MGKPTFMLSKPGQPLRISNAKYKSLDTNLVRTQLIIKIDS